MWLDLTHASEASLEQLVPLLEAAGQPLLFTHTSLRSYRPAERALSDEMLRRVGASGGIVGLLPSEDAFQRQPPIKYCPATCTPQQCGGSVHAFASMYERVAAAIGADSVMLGSDHNGGMRHLRPACGTGTDLDAESGLYHVGQTKTLWQALRALGVPVAPPGAPLSRFLEAWSRVKPRNVSALVDPEGSLPTLPSRDEVKGPSTAVSVGVGVSGANTGGEPGLLAQLDLYVRKDVGLHVEVEPIFYLLHVNADVSLTPAHERLLHYGEVSFAPLGVRLYDLDNLLVAEALRTRLRRHHALDQLLVAKAALAHGVVRLMPGVAKVRNRHNLFVQLETDLLGYQYLRHYMAVEDLHGVFVAGGTVMLGAALRPVDTFRLAAVRRWRRRLFVGYVIVNLQFRLSVRHRCAGGIEPQHHRSSLHAVPRDPLPDESRTARNRSASDGGACAWRHCCFVLTSAGRSTSSVSRSV